MFTNKFVFGHKFVVANKYVLANKLMFVKKNIYLRIIRAWDTNICVWAQIYTFGFNKRVALVGHCRI